MALDLSSSPKPPPAKARQQAATKRAASNKQAEREEGVNGLFQVAGAVAMFAKQPADAAACASHGPNIAREAAQLAESNEGFGKTLDYITAVGPFAALLAAAMPFALQIMVNHNRLPASIAGVVPGVVDPEQLSAQARRDALRMAAEMEREAQEAQREIASIQAQQAKNADANGRRNTDSPATNLGMVRA